MLGYDRLVERAAAPSVAEAADIAHDHPLDKLLAEYFLSKRGENVEMNKMLKDLAKVFEDPSNPGQPMNLDEILQKQRSGKNVEPRLLAENMRAFMELDTITARALQKDKNGLSQELRQVNIKDTKDPCHY